MTTIKPLKYLCLDYGEKRVGVAVGLMEEGGPAPLAFPRPAILRSTRLAFFERLLELLEEEQPAAVVIGLPVRRDGSESLATRQVRNFAASLRRRCGLPLYFMDETLSSSEAESRLREGGHTGLRASRASGLIDSQAAVGILESFLSLPEERRVRAGE